MQQLSASQETFCLTELIELPAQY